ncbi:unnamed protein product [Musa textilis]
MDTEAGEEAKNAGDGSPTAEREDKEEGDGSPAAPAEAGREEAKEEEGGDEAKEKVEGEKRKRGRKRKAAADKSGEEGEGMPTERKRLSVVVREGATSVERPSRERKTVERFSEMSLPRSPVPKTLSFKQGSGEKLKDIPNVFFKLSKRKADDNLQALHGILFGRKANVHYLKRNILQFSGFVWSENEAKQRTRFKEKLDKCKKERLLDFCDLLDIHAVKASSKKEEIIANLVEFLESPCVTRDVVLAEKEEKKRGRAKGRSHSTSGEASSDRRIKKQRKSHGQSAQDENEDNEEGVSVDTKEASSDGEGDGNAQEESDHDMSHEENEEDEQEEPEATNKSEDEPNLTHGNKKGSSKEMNKQGSRASTEEKSATRKNSAKVTLSSPRKSDPVDDSDSEPRSTTKSKQDGGRKGRANEKPPATKENTRKKRSAKSESKVTEKKRGKVKTSKAASSEPSTEELHAVVSDILKEVDFNTATLADILRQLGAHFKMNLMGRKAEVKRIIEDVINSMSDDEDGEEDEDGAEDAKEDDTKEGSDDGDGDK